MRSFNQAKQEQQQLQDDENRSCHQGSVSAKEDNDSTIMFVDGGHDNMAKRPGRTPLCSLNLNHNSMNTSSSHNSQQQTKDGSTPHSLKSRGSLVVVDNNKYGHTMDPIKLRYVLTPHYDDDHVDDSDTNSYHGYESAQEDHNCTRNIHIHSLSPPNNISHDMNSITGTASIGTSHCNKSTGVDYDSVIYSGYAGSVSAAPSELSDGYSVEDDDGGKDPCGNGRNGNVWSQALQSAVEGGECSKWGRRNRPLLVARGGGVAHSDDGSASCRGDFSVQMKKMREQRRKKRLDSMKDYRASILTEFRAFLSRNGRDGNNCDDKNDAPGENGSNATIKTPNLTRARERCESNDFTPTYINGHIPWIVFEKDIEEDVSTIHGGSRCEGLAGSPKSEMALEQNSGILNRLDHGTDEEHANVEQEHGMKSKMTTCICSKNGEKMEMVYILLLVLSIATVVAVVAIVVVQL